MRRSVRRLRVRLLLAGGVSLRTEAGPRVAVLRRAERVPRDGGRRHALGSRRLPGAAAAAGHSAHWNPKKILNIFSLEDP